MYLDLGSVVGFLSEHPEDELALLVGVEGGGEDDVVARRELEPPGHLAQVYKGLAPGTAATCTIK